MYKLVDVKEKVWLHHSNPSLYRVYFVYKVKRVGVLFRTSKWIEESEYYRMLELGLIKDV